MLFGASASDSIWDELLQQVELKFEDALLPDERTNKLKLQEHVNTRDLFANLSLRNGIVWKEGTVDHIHELHPNDVAGAIVQLCGIGTSEISVVSISILT